MFGRRKSAEVARDVMGRDPAWYAAMEGDVSALSNRLKAGLDVDHADKDGMSMLSVASHYGRRQAVQLLLAHGANPNLADRKFDNPPLWAATREACASHASSDFDVGVIADLLAAGADPNHLNAAGKAPPGWAEGEDDRRREVQALYRAHGFEGEFKL
jgi:uncharacterized protein